MNTTEAFTILSIFNAMQFSVGTLPWSLKMITEANVSLPILSLPVDQPFCRLGSGACSSCWS